MFDDGLTLVGRVPRGHEVALADIATGEAVRRYGVASGRRKTWAEQWRLSNALVLFNPVPVT